jgi:hypothetical protein
MSQGSGITGGCACGAVRYAAAGPPRLMLKCHCRDCQRASGAGHIAVMMLPREAVALQGELRVYVTTGDAGHRVERGFCPSCGSPVLNRLERLPGFVGLLAGSLDEPALFRPAADIFTASAQPWDALAPDTAKHERGLPPR